MNTTQRTANDNTVTSTVARDNGQIVYRNIQEKAHKFRGSIVPGRVLRGQHAAIVAGQSVTLWGVDMNHESGFRPYRKEFKIGDTAVCGSYNLTYTGTIVAITEKTITIQERGCKVSRLSVYEFSEKNDNFDLAAIESRNAQNMMEI